MSSNLDAINQSNIELLDEDLRKWFKEKWVRFGPDGKIRGACARGDDSEGKPKCLPQSKAHSLGKKGRKYAASKKRREDPNSERSGKAINVATKKKKKVSEGATYYNRDILFEAILYEGFMDSAKQYLGDKINSSAANIKGAIVDMTSAGILIKDIVKSPEYLNDVNVQLYKQNMGLIKQMNQLSQGNQTVAGVWNQFKEKITALISKQGWMGFLSRLGSYGFLKYMVTNISALKDSVVKTLIAKLDIFERILSSITMGGFLEFFDTLASVKTYFLDVLTYIKNKLMLKPVGATKQPQNVVEDQMSADEYKEHLINTLPQFMQFLEKTVLGFKPSKEQVLSAIETAYIVMQETGNIQQARKALMDELNTLHQMSQGKDLSEEILDELKCWPGYTRVKGVPAGALGSCKKKTSEDLDSNQKRVGQLGPTEKVGKRGPIGKLVGANESINMNTTNLKDQLIKKLLTLDSSLERNYLELATLDELKSMLDKLKHSTNEAINPAQQAAIAIAMKKAGKKPKGESAIMKGLVDETLGMQDPGTYEQMIAPIKTVSKKDRTMKMTSESVVDEKICPECGGPAESNRLLAEKKDACYHKVKARYKVWPSAYASGALVKCRKKGAKNWGNSTK